MSYLKAITTLEFLVSIETRIFNQGSDKSYTNFHFILLIKVNAVFRIGHLNYCTGVPRATRMFPWGSALAKKLKTTGLEIIKATLNLIKPVAKKLQGIKKVF